VKQKQSMYSFMKMHNSSARWCWLQGHQTSQYRMQLLGGFSSLSTCRLEKTGMRKSMTIIFQIQQSSCLCGVFIHFFAQQSTHVNQLIFVSLLLHCSVATRVPVVLVSTCTIAHIGFGSADFRRCKTTIGYVSGG